MHKYRCMWLLIVGFLQLWWLLTASQAYLLNPTSVCLSLSLSLSVFLPQPFVLFMPRPLGRPEISSFTCRARWQIKTPSTRNSSNACMHVHIHTDMQIHSNRLICPSPFLPLAHTHWLSHTLRRAACWVITTGQSRSEEEAECDLKTLAWTLICFLFVCFFWWLLKKRPAARTQQIWRPQTQTTNTTLPPL